jgi:hypothetical protein
MYWGPIKPATWPQDGLRVPGGAGARFMPPLEAANVEVAKRESFTMSGTFALPTGIIAAGQVFNLFIQTDQDGDFWCDQIYMVAWLPGSSALGFNPFAGTMQITDVRTGRQLGYPDGLAVEFLKTFILFPDDAGFDPASSPLPDGFRSTATLPQPVCFTRQGGIQLAYTLPASLNFTGVTPRVDIAFGGWKEYAHASR